MIKSRIFLKEHFMSYVQKSDNPDGCWEWIGARNDRGYGQFRIENKICGAHRVSYALFVGDIPDNLLVCHSCDNPGCVNFSHLFLGTYQDNTDDKVKKNRQSHVGVKGENNGLHKLTEQNIYQIREMIEQGYTQREVAKLFGVSQMTISQIKTSKNWGWLK